MAVFEIFNGHTKVEVLNSPASILGHGVEFQSPLLGVSITQPGSRHPLEENFFIITGKQGNALPFHLQTTSKKTKNSTTRETISVEKTQLPLDSQTLL